MWGCGAAQCAVMHNAAFQHLGLDWCYLAFAVAPAALADAVRGMQALGIAGVNAAIRTRALVA